MKLTTKEKQHIKWQILAISLIIGVNIIAYNYWKLSKEYNIPFTDIKRTTAHSVALQTPLERAIAIAQQAGIQESEIKCLLHHESGGNVNALNVNKNGTVDIGPLQWNQIHIKSGFITLECAANLECAMKKLVEKYKHDGNLNAWYGYRYNCQYLAQK